MRMLFLSTSMGMGGADQQLLSAAQVLRDRGHEVLIVSMTPLGPMGLQARSMGIATESLEMRRGVPDPRGLLRLVAPRPRLASRTSSTATWCTPTSWPARSGWSRRCRRWSPPSTISTRVGRSGWPPTG